MAHISLSQVVLWNNLPFPSLVCCLLPACYFGIQFATSRLRRSLDYGLLKQIENARIACAIAMQTTYTQNAVAQQPVDGIAIGLQQFHYRVQFMYACCITGVAFCNVIPVIASLCRKNLPTPLQLVYAADIRGGALCRFASLRWF